MQFYKNLKRARVRMGKSQIEVAKAVGISNAALSNYETGYREPDLDTLCALSRYYGLTLDELLDVNGEQHEPIYDLSPVLKNKYIAYKGEVFELKDSQKRALLRELDNLFTKFEKSKVEDKSSKPKTYKHGNPHINRAGLANSAGSLAARRNIKQCYTTQYVSGTCLFEQFNQNNYKSTIYLNGKRHISRTQVDGAFLEHPTFHKW